MSALLELAERCEKATEPDRELDLEIWCVHKGHTIEWRKDPNVPFGTEGEECWLTRKGFRYGDPWARRNTAEGFQYIVWKHRSGSFHSRGTEVPPYTGSLDAALSLAPKGSVWRYAPSRHVPHQAQVMSAAETGGWAGFSDHAAPLALCAAALRSRAAMSPHKDEQRSE